MTRHRSIGLLATIVLITAAACSGDNGSTTTEPTTVTTAQSTNPTTTTPPTSPTSTTAASSTTSSPTTATSTPETAPTTNPPTSDTTDDPSDDEDWVTVIQQLVDLRDELYATSDPTRVGEVCSDAAHCYAQMVAQLTDAQSNGWRVVDQGPLTILSAHVESITSADFDIAAIRTDVERTTEHGRIVDADGSTVYELEPDEERPLQGEIRWTLIHTPAGWRLLDQETIS